MFHTLYQYFPLHIDPIAFSIGSISIRWYALSYLVGFGVIYGLLLMRIKRGEIEKVISHQPSDGKNLILDFLLLSFFSVLIGGRIGYFLFYNYSYFASNPLAIISPFENGKFVGLYGMSYHGALIGIIIGSYIFSRIKKIDFLQWADFVVPAVPLGYFFGRIGNFFNGELYGRVTTSPLGMYFANGSLTLRHPSQLYEAFLEGLVLFVLLWKMRNKKFPKGTLLAMYIIGYGFFRIIAEFFRQPDPQTGFLFYFFTLGQLLSLAMVAAGIFLFSAIKKNDTI